MRCVSGFFYIYILLWTERVEYLKVPYYTCCVCMCMYTDVPKTACLAFCLKPPWKEMLILNVLIDILVANQLMKQISFFFFLLAKWGDICMYLCLSVYLIAWHHFSVFVLLLRRKSSWRSRRGRTILPSTGRACACTARRRPRSSSSRGSLRAWEESCGCSSPVSALRRRGHAHHGACSHSSRTKTCLCQSMKTTSSVPV